MKEHIILSKLNAFQIYCFKVVGILKPVLINRIQSLGSKRQSFFKDFFIIPIDVEIVNCSSKMGIFIRISQYS
jgi:hypothetical protein